MVRLGTVSGEWVPTVENRDSMQKDTTMAKAATTTNTRSKYTVVQDLALPVLSLVENQEAIIRVEGPIRLGKPKANNEKSADMAPITVLEPYTDSHGTDFAANTRAMICVSAILKSRLEDNFPSGDYVGKIFAVTCTGKIPGSRAKGYTIQQLQAA